MGEPANRALERLCFLGGVNIKKGVAIWNYTQKSVWDCSQAFHSAGFDAISWVGHQFGDLTKDDAARLADFLKAGGMCFTIHGYLPNPDKDEEIAVFHDFIKFTAQWQEKYGLLNGLTFDAWHDKKRMMPYVAEALKALRGSGAFLACEDFPLNTGEMEIIAPYLTAQDDYGILIDAGHMNLRQAKKNDHTGAAFIQAFADIPLKVRELHLHDNKGVKDNHMYLGYGTLPLPAVVKGLKNIHFDGIITVEIVQSDWPLDDGSIRGWPLEQGIAYAQEAISSFKALWDNA
jgi:sugar phosphate isomerase/epimerase